jgi:methyltransferase-like protein/ubiquinone/menaquinone biosynthesis C-methylase UbiE
MATAEIGNVTSVTSTYDEVLYPSYAHPQTHPERLAVLATLFGMRPVAPAQARILELACGQGGNLIPLANTYPDSQCVGIDLSEKQIASGQKVIDDLDLRNIQLRHESILDFPNDAGKFDYIIAHGVFSWVGENVRDKILQICSEHLSEHGVAIVSYNTYPGWHQRRMIRDMMQYHTKRFGEPQKRIEQAKAFLGFMTQAVSDESAYGKSLHEETRTLASADPAYFFHEQLEEVNEPKYFHEFADQAASHGLQYMTEAELTNLNLERYPPHIADVLHKMDRLQREQYLDFLMRRTFRQTLLCHREVTCDPNDMPARISDLWVASSLLVDRSPQELRGDQPIAIDLPGGKMLTINDPLIKAAFVILARAWPESISFADLQASVRREVSPNALVVQSSTEYQRDTQTLSQALVHAFISDMVQFRVSPSSFIKTPTATPKACPLARYQANANQQITNREHRMVNMDPISRRLLGLLDGSTSNDELVDHLVRFVNETDVALQHNGALVRSPEKVRELLVDQLASTLNNLANQAFLVR